MNTRKIKVKFITVVWGARYIEELARVSLPSYLAAGNLPALAEAASLEVLIMTSEESRSEFERHPAFAVLRSLCDVRFIYIDDLITTGVYGVTLTSAYARGIRDSGADQIDTTFIFMNSDFVLADGALKSVVRRLSNGERCIMAPSLRVNAEQILPHLLKSVDHRQHTLTIQPREMVKLALTNLHPTVMAKTVTQDFITCGTHNQIYWQVDESTLLVRHYLIFMLAIKPEVPLGQVNSYCDYGFVPEMVPSGEFTIFDDSDDFFMIELQPADQERHLLRSGNSSPKEIARSLSEWTTREHRSFADTDICFHVEGPPKQLHAQRACFQDFMNDVKDRLSPIPVNHAGHRYWSFGVEAWAELRAQQNDDNQNRRLPPEFASPLARAESTNLRDWPTYSIWSRQYRRILQTMMRLSGRMPDVAIWHNLWVDSKLVLNWVRAIQKRGQRAAIVHLADSTLPGPLRKRAAIDALSLEDLLDASPAVTSAYQDVLLHVTRARLGRIAEYVEISANLVRPGGTLAVFVEHKNYELDAGDFTGELPHYIENFYRGDWMKYQISAKFAGGSTKRALRRMERRWMNRLLPGRLRDLPVCTLAITVWPFVAILTAANNLRMRNTGSNCPSFCSSALITLTKPPMNSGRRGDL